MKKTKLTKTKKLGLFKSLSAEDQENLNPLLSAFDFAHDAKDGWLLEFHGGGRNFPYEIPARTVIALHHLLKRVWRLPLRPEVPLL